jgi:hypothetical protein
MRVVGQGIEKKVSQSMARKMFGRRKAWSKNKAVRINASRGGLAEEIVLDEAVCVQEPQDRSRNRRQEAHPDIEKRRRYFVGIVERAENKTLIRQPAFGTGRRDIRNQPLGVVWLVAMREPNDLLAVKGLLVHRQHDGIGDHIVDEIRAHCSGKADKAQLHRCGPPRGNSGAHPWYSLSTQRGYRFCQP